MISGPEPIVAQMANEVWTVDFKGFFYTADRRRVCALTVRDLASRYLLLVRHVALPDERGVGPLMRRLFKKHGLPRMIRVDNGPPFGGVGPRGWSRLAVAWVRLGIEVGYGRPRCPQDNAAHEQMHRILKRETATPPALTLRAQQCRFDRWRQHYNLARPHHALKMQLPAAFYPQSELGARSAPPWEHPAGSQRIRTDRRGRCQWSGRQRLIGRAFGDQVLALKSLAPGIVEVYFGPHLLGQLHARDRAGLRAVRFARR